MDALIRSFLPIARQRFTTESTSEKIAAIAFRPKRGAGHPVGIQIIGPYLEDATPLDIAGQLADIVGGFKPPKGF